MQVLRKVNQRICACGRNYSQELESMMASTTVQMKMMTMMMMLQTTRRDVLPLQQNISLLLSVSKEPRMIHVKLATYFQLRKEDANTKAYNTQLTMLMTRTCKQTNLCNYYTQFQSISES